MDVRSNNTLYVWNEADESLKSRKLRFVILEVYLLHLIMRDHVYPKTNKLNKV